MRLFVSLLLGCSVSLPGQQTPKDQQPAPKEVTLPITVIPSEEASKVVPPDRVVIQVGDVKITAAQLDALIDVYPPSTRVFARGPGREQFADTLIRMIVLGEEARKRKLNESDKFKEQLRFSEENLLASTLNDLLPKEVPTDEAGARKLYDEHRCEYQTWKARHLVVRFTGSALPVKPGSGDLSESEALTKVRDLRDRISAGADFAGLARAESDDMASGINGGDLGEIRHGQVMPSIEESLCQLNTGEVSQPIRTPVGFHLVQLLSKQTREYSEMRGELEQKLRSEAVRKKIEEMVAQTKIVKDPEYFAPIKMIPNEPKK